MKKLPQSRYQTLAPVKLYLDEVERIVEALRGGSDTVSISTDEYVLSDIEELAELGKDYLTHLDLKTQQPPIEVNMRPSRVSLYIASDEPMSRGIFEEVKQILTSRKQPFAWLITSSWVWAPAVALYPSMSLLFTAIKQKSWLFGVLALASFVLGAAWWVFSFRHSLHKSSIIILRHRIDSPSFLKRNRDELLRGIILCVIGFVLGLLADKLIP